MSDPQHEMRQWLAEQLDASPHGTKGRLAQVLGIRPDAIGRMINGDPSKETRSIKAHEFVAMQDFFRDLAEQDPDRIGDGTLSTVPLMGMVGAGAQIDPEFEQTPPEGLDQINLPIPVPGDMVAFKVQGTSMLPRYDEGDVIIVWRDQKRSTDSFLGEEAAIRTRDGRRFLKTIRRGEQGYTLESWNDHPIENQEIDWVGEIYVTVRASQLKRMVIQIAKQGGLQGQLKLRA